MFAKLAHFRLTNAWRLGSRLSRWSSSDNDVTFAATEGNLNFLTFLVKRDVFKVSILALRVGFFQFSLNENVR